MKPKKIKSIILQGYLHDANFGDILSGYLFYKRCQNAGFQKIDFFQFRNLGIGDFFRKQTGYTVKKNLLSCLKSDAFVIISGGSFWNDKRNPHDALVRFARFIFPALIYQLRHKPVYILGVGGGPVDTLWLRKKMIKVINKSKIVTFRDDSTKKIFDDYGVKKKTVVTADTMLTIRKEMLDPFEESEKLNKIAEGRKKILLHLPDGVNENSCVADKILPGLIQFLCEHKEYLLVISNDNKRELGEEEKYQNERIRILLKDAALNFYEYKYHDSWQMCSLINEMDCVITLKLHVGVVSCALGKSVVSFPVHREKTDNFYRMINQSERCINMRKLEKEMVYGQLCRFINQPVFISEELRTEAEKNLAALDQIIEK